MVRYRGLDFGQRLASVMEEPRVADGGDDGEGI